MSENFTPWGWGTQNLCAKTGADSGAGSCVNFRKSLISIAKMPVDKFRKDMFKSKRKPLSEIWNGNTLEIAEIVRFTPSACNTQPWIVENTGYDLMVYRFKKPGKRGIMPADKVRYYNKIDMGIFLFMLETCLEHKNYTYERTLFADTTDDSVEQTLIAKYTYLSK